MQNTHRQPTALEKDPGRSFAATCPRARVLVVEDHEINRRVAQLMLEPFGCEVVFAENGLLAVRACADQRFDIVLMDLQMPVMDGFTAIREIRAREASLKEDRLPIAMLSANVGPEYEAAAHCAGADAYICKPLSLDRLMEGMDEAVRLARRLAPPAARVA